MALVARVVCLFSAWRKQDYSFREIISHMYVIWEEVSFRKSVSPGKTLKFSNSFTFQAWENLGNIYMYYLYGQRAKLCMYLCMCVYIQFNKGRGKLCRGLEYKQREIPENKEKEQVVFQQSDKKKNSNFWLSVLKPLNHGYFISPRTTGFYRTVISLILLRILFISLFLRL